MKKPVILSLVAVMAFPAIGATPLTGPREVQNQLQMQKVRNVFTSQSAPVAMGARKKSQTARAKTVSDFEGRKFIATVIYADSWADMSITRVPYGLYELTVESDGVKKEAKYTEMSHDWMGGAIKRGHFYGIRNINMFGSLTGVATSDINIADWTKVSEYLSDDPSYDKLPTAMAYNAADGEVYGIFYNYDLTGLNTVRFNTRSLSAELIDKFPGKFNVVAMASAPDGYLYLINLDGDFYRFDAGKSELKKIGNTGVNVSAYSQSMTWDSKSNSFVWAAVTPIYNGLYSVDPESGAATIIKRLSDGEQIVCLYPVDNDAAQGAPAAPVGLEWKFSSPGADNGSISLRTPGAGKLTVRLDGKEMLSEVSVSANESKTISFEGLSNKTHHVSAVVKNDNGFSPVAESFQYVGLDVPRPVTDLVFSEDNGTARLSWTAPAGGVEEGYINPEALYYTIVRIPDNITVEDHWTSTTWQEQLPTGVRRYAYRVTPYNGAGKEGEPVLSNSIVYGNSYDMPYSEDFASEGSFDVYTPIDGDGDGRSWSLNTYNKQITCSANGNGDSDDWVLTPKMNFEAGKIYRVTLHARNMWAGKPDNVAVGYCPGDKPGKADITKVETIEINTPSMTLLDHYVDFQVPQSGEYKIALGLVTPQGQSNGGVFISPLKVDYLGLPTAPGAPSDMTVTPDASRENKATVSFTAPSLTIAGKTLAGPLTANLYRDGDMSKPVATASGIACGAKGSVTDNSIPAAGQHTFTLRFSNTSGEGTPAGASAFIGVFAAPVEIPLTMPDDVAFFTYLPVNFEESVTDPELHLASWGEPSMEIYHVNFNADSHELYVASPLMRFDDESVYSLSFDDKSQSYFGSGTSAKIEVMMGSEPKADSFTEKCFDYNLPGYSGSFGSQKGLIVVTKGGDRYLAFHADGISNGYLDYFIRNFKLTYEGSALAPDVVTDVLASSDLTSKITLKAPAKDYAGRSLKSLTKVEIYRNGSVLPVHTFDNPEPGAALEWTDDNALLGHNSYFIVPSNEHGRGNAVTVTSFIGFDAPEKVGDFAIVPETDNQHALISWTAPRRGVNGGVLDEENLTYSLFRINTEAADEDSQIEILLSGLKETSAIAPREASDRQTLNYYGVMVVTPQGVSEPVYDFTLLGKPYTLPFEESFADGQPQTGLWLNCGNPNLGLQSMPTTDDILAYNGYEGESQDGDGGMLMFLNGGESEWLLPFSVLTPKVTLGDSKEPKVSFWLYKGNQSGAYSANPTMQIEASSDEVHYEDLGTVTWTETSPKWVYYEFPLTAFEGKEGTVIFRLTMTAGGYQDIVLLDNFRVDGVAGAGNALADKDAVKAFGLKGAVLTRGASGQPVRMFTADGKLVDSWIGDDSLRAARPGVYIVTIGDRPFKVAVK